MALLNLRVKTETLDRWKQAAGPRGLSEMIRTVIDDHVARVETAALDPAIRDPVAEVDAAASERRQTVEGLKKLLEAKSEPKPKPARRSEPLDVGRRCDDHPDLLVHPDQKTCRYLRCGKRIP